jgi:phospholipase/carboxylesterase
MTDLGFIHRNVPATDVSRPPLLLLHGTGGDENDLIAIATHIAPGAALLSPRGKVSENGQNRFFRRFAEGALDLDDLKARTTELAAFIAAARAAYDLAAPIAFGFSNGGNIAASLLLSQPHVLAGAVLMRSVLPFEPSPAPRIARTPVLLLSGAADPMVPAASRDRLAAVLGKAGAAIVHKVIPGGHSLTNQDLAFAKQWLEELK